MTDRYDSHPDDYDSDNSGINLNKGIQQNQSEQPLPRASEAQEAWPRPYADRRAAYGPAAQESYPPAPPSYPAPYGQQPLSERASGLALAGFITALGSVLLDLTFIFAFLGFFGSITAVVLSIVGLVRDVNGRKMKGRGFALTGIIVGGATLVISISIFILLIVIGLTSDHSNLQCQPDYSSTYGCAVQTDNSGTNI